MRISLKLHFANANPSVLPHSFDDDEKNLSWLETFSLKAVNVVFAVAAEKNCYFQKMLMNCLISVDDDHEVVVVAVCWLHWDVIISTIKRKISLLCHLTILRLSGDTRKKYFSRVWYRLASGRLNPPATQICINQLHLEMALKLFFFRLESLKAKQTFFCGWVKNSANESVDMKWTVQCPSIVHITSIYL